MKNTIVATIFSIACSVNATCQSTIVLHERSDFLKNYSEGVHYNVLQFTENRKGVKKFKSETFTFGEKYTYTYPDKNTTVEIYKNSLKSYSLKHDTLRGDDWYREIAFTDTIYFSGDFEFLTFFPHRQLFAIYRVGNKTSNYAVELNGIYTSSLELANGFNYSDTNYFKEELHSYHASLPNRIEEIRQGIIKKEQEKREADLKINCNKCLVEDANILKIAKGNFSIKHKDCTLKKAYYDKEKDNNWEIIKNDYGVILKRIKPAYIYYTDSSDKCFLQFAYITQDYSGGGTYGASYLNYQASFEKNCSEF